MRLQFRAASESKVSGHASNPSRFSNDHSKPVPMRQVLFVCALVFCI